MSSRALSRRRLLTTFGAAVAYAPVAQLLGCGARSSADGTTTDIGTNTGTGNGTAQVWATGGTASMSGTYPDPFAAGIGTTCSLTCSATIGPCYAQTIERADISEGRAGLPVRLSFLVVDEACKPVANA